MGKTWTTGIKDGRAKMSKPIAATITKKKMSLMQTN